MINPLKPCETCGHPSPRLADTILWTEDTDSTVYLGICDVCKTMSPINADPIKAADLWNQKQDFIRSTSGPGRPAVRVDDAEWWKPLAIGAVCVVAVLSLLSLLVAKVCVS